MIIKNILFSKGLTGYYFDDQVAIKNNAINEGLFYIGSPRTEGFHSIRQSGESISIMIILEDGQMATGDCAAVQYSGTAGRDQLFLADDYIALLQESIAPLLIGKELKSFRSLARMIDNFTDYRTDKKLHAAIRYGLSQALLDAVAKSRHQLMVDVIIDEYSLNSELNSIPIFTQSGDDRYVNVDKMIIKQSAVLPHGLINNIPEKIGFKGEKLFDYISWVKNRILEHRNNEEYSPVIHIDVYGTIGIVFNNDMDAIVDYLLTLEKAASPFQLNIEGPVDMQEREAQVLALKEITKKLNDRKSKVQIVADEWCNTFEDVCYFADQNAGHMIQIKTPDLGSIHNTVEAILYCKEKGVLSYQGGTCNETDRSAQVCVHVAMAAKPEQMLAKPGMGVDEGLMIITNEMNRILALKSI